MGQGRSQASLEELVSVIAGSDSPAVMMHCSKFAKITSAFFISVVLTALMTPSLHAGEHLQKALRGIPKGGEAGIAVWDCDTDRWLLQRNSAAPLRLASVTKIYTAAAALWSLGPEYHFTTLLADDGAGNILLWGGGNPGLDEHHSAGNPDRFIAQWAQDLRAAGVTHIPGDIIILQPSSWGDEIRPPTWPMTPDNVGKHYTAPTSFFAFNNNCIDLMAEPGTGHRPIVRCRPVPGPHLNITNNTKRGSPTKFLVHRDPDSNNCTVSGKIGKKTAWFPVAIHRHPVELHANHLQQRLTQAGIEIAGRVRISSDLASLMSATPFSTQRTSLWSALTILLQRSNNFYGEQIHRTYAIYHLPPNGPETGSSELGNSIRNTLLAERQLDSGTSLLDGSGLSYENRATAAAVCAFLEQLTHEPWAEQYRDALKQSSVGGAQVAAKTGTLSVCRTLAGYWTNKQGRRRTFTILLDKGSSNNINWARYRRDAILAALIKDFP